MRILRVKGAGGAGSCVAGVFRIGEGLGGKDGGRWAGRGRGFALGGA